MSRAPDTGPAHCPEGERALKTIRWPTWAVFLHVATHAPREEEPGPKATKRIDAGCFSKGNLSQDSPKVDKTGRFYAWGLGGAAVGWRTRRPTNERPETRPPKNARAQAPALANFVTFLSSLARACEAHRGGEPRARTRTHTQPECHTPHAHLGFNA